MRALNLSNYFNSVFVLLFCIIFFIKCDIYSNELPAVKVQKERFTEIKYLYESDPALLITYSQLSSKSYDSIWVNFTNLLSSDLAGLQVIIEEVRGSHFDSCLVVLNTSLDLPKATQSKDLLINFARLNKKNINNYRVYITDVKNLVKNPLAGYYRNWQSISMNTENEALWHAQVYGIIEIDGKSLFRIRKDNSTAYNIKDARFENNDYFEGLLFSDETSISSISLSGNSQAESDNENFKASFELSDILKDSTSQFKLHLTKK